MRPSQHGGVEALALGVHGGVPHAVVPGDDDDVDAGDAAFLEPVGQRRIRMDAGVVGLRALQDLLSVPVS